MQEKWNHCKYRRFRYQLAQNYPQHLWAYYSLASISGSIVTLFIVSIFTVRRVIIYSQHLQITANSYLYDNNCFPAMEHESKDNL